MCRADREGSKYQQPWAAAGRGTEQKASWLRGKQHTLPHPLSRVSRMLQGQCSAYSIGLCEGRGASELSIHPALAGFGCSHTSCAQGELNPRLLMVLCSLKLVHYIPPALHPALIFSALVFCPTVFPVSFCCLLPSPSLPRFLLRFSPLLFSPHHSHLLPPLLLLSLPSSYPISFLSSLQPGTVLFCTHQLHCCSCIAVNVSTELRRSPEPLNKEAFHFSSGIESSRAAGPRGLLSGDSCGHIHPLGEDQGREGRCFGAVWGFGCYPSVLSCCKPGIIVAGN